MKKKIVKTVALIIALITVNFLRAQQQFSFRYKFKPLKNYCVERVRIQTDTIIEEIPTKRIIDKSSSIICKEFKRHEKIDGDSCITNIRDCYTYIREKHDTIENVQYKIKIASSNKKGLRGLIKINSTKDTLFIIPWEVNDTNETGLVQNVDDKPASLNPRHKYYVVLAKGNVNSYGRTPFFGWDKKNEIYKHGGHPMIKLNYFQRQLTATNVPITFNTSIGKFQANPLSANVTHLWVWGHTRIYKSQFVASKDRFIGIGPFAGFSTLISPNDNISEALGLNWGGNVVYGLYNFNIIGAVGWEYQITTPKSSPNFYVGLGVGFKIINLIGPSDNSGSN